MIALLSPKNSQVSDHAILHWHDESIDWSKFDAVVIRSAWDYVKRPTDFLAWCHRVSEQSRLFSPAALVEWNSNKRYMKQLEECGVPIPKTVYFDPSQRSALTSVAGICRLYTLYRQTLFSFLICAFA